MRKSYTIIFALIVLLSMAMSVEALEYKTISRYNGVAADATWVETNGNTTTYTYLYVTESDSGTDISLYIFSEGPDYWSDKSGYIFTQDDVFSMSKKLDSASLSDVQIEVYDWDTGRTETLTVSADWTGKGDIIKSSYKSMSKYDDYVWRTSDSSSYRDAIATGSINGNDLESSYYANLIKFKQAYMDMEK